MRELYLMKPRIHLLRCATTRAAKPRCYSFIEKAISARERRTQNHVRHLVYVALAQCWIAGQDYSPANSSSAPPSISRCRGEEVETDGALCLLHRSGDVHIEMLWGGHLEENRDRVYEARRMRDPRSIGMLARSVPECHATFRAVVPPPRQPRQRSRQFE